MKLLLVDDHKIVLEGLKILFMNYDCVNNVETLTNPKLVIPFLNSTKIDMLITDLNMPDIDGIELIDKVKHLFPDIKIGVLSMYFNKSTIEKLRKSQIDIYLNKNANSEQIEMALNAAKSNENYFMNEQEDFSFETPSLNYKDTYAILHSLSPRELEVYKLILKNKKSYEIAQILYLSINTIMFHRKNILKKTGCNSIQELTMLGLKMGIV